MATTTYYLPAPRADFKTTAFPAFTRFQGTNYPVMCLAYDATTREDAYFHWVSNAYSTGNVTATCLWYADTASSGGVTWGASLACITPDADTQDMETKGFATENTFDDGHLGTTGQRLHQAPISISNLDSIAAGDFVEMKLGRVVSAANDNMTGDALLVGVLVSYTST